MTPFRCDQSGSWPPNAEVILRKSRSPFVEIFGICLPSLQASEEYLSSFAVFCGLDHFNYMNWLQNDYSRNGARKASVRTML
jgi:hypothetical protein